MSDYVYFLDQLRDTRAKIAKLEAVLKANPSDFATELNLRSLLKMEENLNGELKRASAAEQIEVCDYRLLLEGVRARYSAKAVAESISAFQDLFTTVFHALRSGPKARARPSGSSTEASKLDFGYVYSGSLSVVFTIPNEQMLFEAELDEAINSTFDIIKLENPNEVLETSHNLGLATVKKLYDWNMTNYTNGFSADVTWRRGEKTKASAYVPYLQSAHLSNIIAMTSEERKDVIRESGVLVGIDIIFRNFHFVVPNGPSYQGKLHSEFNVSYLIEVERTYEAVIEAAHRLNFATEQQQTTYKLLSLIR